MNTQTTLQEGKDYEVVVDAYVTNEDLEVNTSFLPFSSLF